MKRGCVRNLNPLVKRTCLNREDGCKTCIGNNCNRMKEFRTCYVRNEQIEPLKLSTSWKDSTKICKNFEDKCFSLVNETGFIIKGCLSEYAEKNNVPINYFHDKYNSTVYSECSASLCNDENIEPLWCFGCDSRDDLNCSRSELVHRVMCPLSLEQFGCYHHIDGEHVQRGLFKL